MKQYYLTAAPWGRPHREWLRCRVESILTTVPAHGQTRTQDFQYKKSRRNWLMIRLGRINDVGKRPGEECWLIVRSLKQCPTGAIHVPVLSPSRELFYKYLNAKKAGQYNQNWFQENYVPRFLHEMWSSMESRKLLDQLYHESKNRDFLLACFCVDEATCHRSIVGGLLLGAGAAIECKPEYAKYYTMFQSLMSSTQS